MILEFLPGALAAYTALKGSAPSLASKAKTIIIDALQHPAVGVGEPVQLTGAYSGIWRRRLSATDEMYYVFDDTKLIVVSFSFTGTSHRGANSGFSMQAFTADEYAAVMAQMAANRGKDSEPKVGLFWYNRSKNELFGVVSHKIGDYTQANASDGRITCSEMHEDVWKREFRKQKYRGDGFGPYIGAYQDKPRGRIFYNIKSDTYEVAVGKWLEEYPQAYELILEEFNLPKEKTSAKYAVHWDIGMSWR